MGTLIHAKDLASAPRLYEMLAEGVREKNRTKPKVQRHAVIQYEHPGLGDNDNEPEEDPYAGFHVEAVQTIGRALADEYPVHGRLFYLEAMGGVLTIELPPLVIKPGCGIVNLVRTPKITWNKVAIRVAGELLERLRLGRERFNQHEFVAAVERIDFRARRRGAVPE